MYLFGFCFVSILILLFHSYIFSCLALTVDEELRRIVLTTKKLLLLLSCHDSIIAFSIASYFDLKMSFFPQKEPNEAPISKNIQEISLIKKISQNNAGTIFKIFWNIVKKLKKKFNFEILDVSSGIQKRHFGAKTPTYW